MDRYEEITSPELATAFNAYWAKTSDYWKDVRDTWAGILKDKESFSMKDTYDGKQLYSSTSITRRNSRRRGDGARPRTCSMRRKPSGIPGASESSKDVERASTSPEDRR